MQKVPPPPLSLSFEGALYEFLAAAFRAETPDLVVIYATEEQNAQSY